jgi:predicted membrane GTPase involved in stress response
MMSRLAERLAAQREFRRGATMLHPECPIEQTVRASAADVQAQLMQEIWRQRWYVDDGALVVAEPKCLRVLARSEGGLRAPVEALQRRYGERLIVEPPSVRYVHGAPVLEPFMNVIVSGPPSHFDAVQKDLGRRQAVLARVDRHPDAFVLEAEAPLGHLLGYRAHIDARFGGAVDVDLWLSRYCPITDEGPYAG